MMAAYIKDCFIFKAGDSHCSFTHTIIKQHEEIMGEIGTVSARDMI